MRAMIVTGALLIATASLLAEPLDGRGQGVGRGPMRGAGGSSPPQAVAGRGGQARDAGMSADEHGVLFQLLSRHNEVTRAVVEIPGGVQTRTTARDPALAAMIRAHVRQMAQHLDQGRPVRQWDPAFRDIFAHAHEIRMQMQDVEGGILVIETSDNPAVVPMIRAHAAKVNAFVNQGPAAAQPPWAGRGRGRGRSGPDR